MNPHAPVYWLGPVGIRIGVELSPLFSERYQGTHGIPRRFFYLFGRRLTLIRRARRSSDTCSASGEHHGPLIKDGDRVLCEAHWGTTHPGGES